MSLDTIRHYHSINAPNVLFYKEFKLKKGDCFDPSMINLQRIRLLQTAYFENVRYLYYPKGKKLPLKFYYTEKSEFFRYQLAPFLSRSKHLGIFAAANWDFISGTTNSYGLKLSYAADEYSYLFRFSNPYWTNDISYTMYLAGNYYDYAYRDLKPGSSYHVSESISGLKLQFRLGLNQSIHSFYTWKKYRLKNGLYKNSEFSNGDDHILGFLYRIDKRDWPIFPRSSYGFSFEYRYIIKKFNRYHAFLQYSKKLAGKFYMTVETESYLNQGNNDHYHRIKYNNDFKIDYFNPYITGNFAILNHLELRFNGNLNFEPNGTRSIKNALSFSVFFNKMQKEISSFKLTDINIDYGINFYFHIRKDIFRIRVHTIENKTYFISLKTFVL